MDPNASTPNEPFVVPGKEPEKYVRTFAGDMEILKKGGVPDLARLPHAATEGDILVPPPPAPPPPNAAPPVPLPEQAPIAVPVTMPGSFAPPVQAFPSVTEMPSPKPSLVTPIETYSGDFSDRVKNTHATTATILAAEQDAATGEPSAPRAAPKPSRNGVLYVIAAAILILAGGAGAYIAYTRYLTALAPVISAPVASAPIFIDERQQISGSGAALLLAIQESVASSFKTNTVRLLYVSTSTDTTVFSQLPITAPGVLLRNINPDGSMAGIVNVNGTQSPFFILSVTSYSNTFSGMLSWEKLMPRVLIKLYPPYAVSTPDTTVASTTVATTTPAKGVKAATPAPVTPTFVPGFVDATVANHDVRVYRDSSGKDVVLYGYWNQTTLVIARDAAAFTEILQRLATSRAQ